MTLTSKLVLRLLDKDGHLLGWTQHEAAVKGDGFLRAASDVLMTFDRDGVPYEVSIHWADVNVETRVPWPTWPVTPVGIIGATIRLFELGSPMVQAGEPPKQRLVPVTTKSVAVAVPTGRIGSTGARLQ